MNIVKIKTEDLSIHPELIDMVELKKVQAITTTMLEFGQFYPLSVVKNEEVYYVINGLARLKVAKENLRDFPTLDCLIITPSDLNIRMTYILENTKGKKSIIQVCKELKEVLKFLGRQQGKKRNFSKYFSGKRKFQNPDRYDFASLLMDCEYSGSTLRNLEKIYDYEMSKPKKERMGLLEKIDREDLSIHNANSLILKKEKMVQEEIFSQAAKVLFKSFKNNSEKPYQIFNQSCIENSCIPDNSISLCIDSHPYALSQRKYRNQDGLMHGQEESIEEYLGNFEMFNREKFKKLKEGGVLVTIIGESYKGGYNAVCPLAILKLKEIGFIILDVVTWEKTNQKYTPHNYRFQNVKEDIIVAYKPGAEPTFSEPKRKGSVNDNKIRRTSSGGFYIPNKMTGITNVIRTSGFDPRELNEIDSNFYHDAPTPTKIYELFIEAYSNPGDYIADFFVGTGTIGVGLKMGRKVIGFDVDPLSIAFSQKRFEWYLNQIENNLLPIAA
jgi:DNA modification methylase